MSPLALLCGTLIDGTEGPARDDAVVVVADGRITAVGGRELVADLEVVDLTGKFVVPGLIDLHNHICFDGDPDRHLDGVPGEMPFHAVQNLDRLLRAGVTTVREAGAPYDISFHAKAAVEAGVVPGPRLFVSGVPLVMTGGHGWNIALEVDGADEARKGARQQLKNGADWIKLLATGGVVTKGEALGAPQMTLEEMTAACEEAHKANRRVLAHAMGPTGIQWALEAGVDTIEHGIWFGEPEIEAMLRHDVYLVPTFSVSWTQSQHGVELGMQRHVIEKATQAAERMFECTAAAASAGVKIAMGTDAGGPGVNHTMVALELELMLSSGACKTPAEVIRSATALGADVLGLADELGTIEPGKLADILVLDADPLADLGAYRSVHMVMKDGVVAHRAAAGAGS
jgi:imidazolonepropionase-like amidohydrolase